MREGSRARVLHVGKFYAPEKGGIETVTRAMVRGIAGAGFDVTVLVSPRRRGRGGEERRDGARIVRLASLGTIWSQPVVPGLGRAIGRVPADLLHLHLPNPLAARAVLRGGGPRPLVVSYHSGIRRQRLAAGIHRRIERRLLRRADRVLVASRAMREAFPVLREAGERLAVVPYGIETAGDGAARRGRKAPARGAGAATRAGENRGAGGPRGRPSVVFVGRLVAYKGLAVLLEAMREVDAVCHLAGRGPEEARLRRLAARGGIADRVRFHGEVGDEEREALLREGDLFVLPSVRPTEAFGIAQLEAMAQGLPVVSTDLPTGVREVNEPGVTGLRVPPGDARALAAAIRSLLGDPARRVRMGRAAAARVRERFGAGRMVAAILSIYDELLGRAGPGDRGGAPR